MSDRIPEEKVYCILYGKLVDPQIFMIYFGIFKHLHVIWPFAKTPTPLVREKLWKHTYGLEMNI
jgi:hypothetical protein